MSLFAEYFVLPFAASSLDEINFDAEPAATDRVNSLEILRSRDAFWEGGPADDFAARYTGDLNVTEAGTYTLFLTSDDGSSLFIDGERVIGNDGLHATQQESVTLDLDAGAHKIEVLYFERVGAQTLSLDWEGPDSNGERVSISGDSLSYGDVADDGVDDAPVDDTPVDDTPVDDTPVDDTPVDDTPVDDTPSGASGLRAEYFALGTGVSSLSEIDFDQTPTVTGTADVLNMLGGNAAFWEGGAQDNFAARYTGALNVLTGGDYTLFLRSDDGSAVYVDGERVINNDGLHGTNERRVTLDLDAGAHEIEVLYFERYGAQTLALDWQGPDSNGERVSISGNSLSHGVDDTPVDDTPVDDTPVDDTPVDDTPVDDTPVDDTPVDDTPVDDTPVDDTPVDDTPSGASGLRAEYFALSTGVSSLSEIDFDQTPTTTGTADVLNMLGGNAAFWEGGAQDNFAARYTGALNVLTGGDYTLFLRSDDGSAVYVDGERVINNDGLHGTNERRVTLDLDAGAHEIEVLYFERYGAQTLALDWQGPDSNGERVSISGDSLSHGVDDTPVDDTPVDDTPVDDTPVDDTPVDDTPVDDTPVDDTPVDDTPVDDTPVDDTPVDDTPVDDTPSGASGLRAEYFALSTGVSSLSEIDFDQTPTATGTADVLNMLGGNAAFWEGGAQDNFAARYTGALNVLTGGDYTLFLRSDDGSAVYVDGERVINNDGLHGTNERRVTLDLDAGAHEIEVRYFESYGAQTLALDWQGPDSNGERVSISGDSLSHGVDDTPVDDTPVDDTPVDDTPVDDTPVDDTPVDDTPVDDTPVDDTPVDDNGEDPGGQDVGSDPSIPGYDGPIPPTTSAEINAFVAAVRAEQDGMGHGGMGPMAAGHMAAMDLVPRDEASHIAIGNGDWDDPDTWHNGEIPGDDATVLIPDGIMVNYDHVSDVSLFTVRVDGMLRFATNEDTRMEVDTMVVAQEGYLQIGTEDNPVQSGVNTDIVFADNGNIDTNWDPMLFSRGLVSLGAAEIHGAEKTAFLDLSTDPMAGDTTLQLSGQPDGWQVGDKLVLTGTHLTGWYWDNDVRDVIHHDSEDEEVFITAINGNTITLDRALEFDHDAPNDELSAYAANMSRNITFSSEGGEDLPVHQRGHVMFMSSDDVDVRYAGFEDLGRTDKSEPAFDVATLSSVDYDSNIKARYSFHLHETGTQDQENPTIAVGNVVDGNPGWGFVQHGAHAEFTDNIAYDVFGAGFAAEDGDETGIWLRNMAIDIEGIGPGDYTVKEGADRVRHDNGRTGDGFFFAGRLVEAAENIAANATNGFVWYHRSAPDGPLTDNLDQPEIGFGADSLTPDDAPIHGFRDNEAFATNTGLIVIKANPAQNHDVRSVFDGFTNWETREGVNLSYTARYTLIDFDLIAARELNPYQDYWPAVTLGANTYDMVINGISIDGFDTGFDLTNNVEPENHTAGTNHNNILIDGEFINVGTNVDELYAGQLQQMLGSQLVDGRLDFDLQTDNFISFRDSVALSGTKTDSIGSTDRQVGTDPHIIEDWIDVARLIANAGYYTTPDGQRIFLVEDFVADRATGDLLKMNHVFTLDMTDAQLANDWGLNQFGGVRYLGEINLGGPAPVAGDDNFVFNTADSQDLYINVLANDYDPDGGAIRVDGLVDPVHGDIFQQDDDTLMYRPDRGFTGTDTFDYWVADEEGNFSQGTVIIEVSDNFV